MKLMVLKFVNRPLLLDFFQELHLDEFEAKLAVRVGVRPVKRKVVTVCQYLTLTRLSAEMADNYRSACPVFDYVTVSDLDLLHRKWSDFVRDDQLEVLLVVHLEHHCLHLLLCGYIQAMAAKKRPAGAGNIH